MNQLIVFVFLGLLLMYFLIWYEIDTQTPYSFGEWLLIKFIVKPIMVPIGILIIKIHFNGNPVKLEKLRKIAREIEKTPLSQICKTSKSDECSKETVLAECTKKNINVNSTSQQTVNPKEQISRSVKSSPVILGLVLSENNQNAIGTNETTASTHWRIRWLNTESTRAKKPVKFSTSIIGLQRRKYRGRSRVTAFFPGRFFLP